MHYTDINEAVAFVAVLSQFLSYPQGGKYLRLSTPAEVWNRVWGSAGDIERIEVYLNATALNAAKESFDSLPDMAVWRGDQLPGDCIGLIEA